MTRVNLVEPHELGDQHLLAEYREITMVPASLIRTLASKAGLRKDKIPPRFVLGKGHVTFFYDKGRYLDKRYWALVRELKRRGVRPDPERNFPLEVFPLDCRKDYRPDVYALSVIRARIRQRLREKPGWYRWTRA